MRKDRVLYHFVDVHDMVSFRVVDKLSMTENEVSDKMGQLNSVVPKNGTTAEVK